MIVYRSVSRDVRPFMSLVSFGLIINYVTDFSVQCNGSQRSYTPSSSIATGCANLAPQEDVQEDWGWKLVHGEVFRTPNNPLVLAALVGNGAQLCSMVGVTLGVSNKLP
jgi:Endomembrane protein 70